MTRQSYWLEVAKDDLGPTDTKITANSNDRDWEPAKRVMRKIG